MSTGNLPTELRPARLHRRKPGHYVTDLPLYLKHRVQWEATNRTQVSHVSNPIRATTSQMKGHTPESVPSRNLSTIFRSNRLLDASPGYYVSEFASEDQTPCAAERTDPVRSNLASKPDRDSTSHQRDRTPSSNANRNILPAGPGKLLVPHQGIS